MAQSSDINSIVNLNIPSSAPDGFTDPQVRAAVEMFLVAQLNMLRSFELYTGATQKDITLWASLQPTDTLIRHQAGRLYVTAGENINAGDFVNLYLDAAILKCRKAQATAGSVRPARGYCSTAGGILLGDRGEVILSQGILEIGGVVPGTSYFLATSAGQATAVAPVAAGQLEQFLGVGIADNLLYIDIALGAYVQH